MRGVAMIGGVTIVFLCASGVPADEKPKLTFTQDGKDLVITTSVTANNSSHVVWTHAIDLGKDVTLFYYVFQNRDLFVRGEGGTRSLKSVELKWRLADTKKDGKGFHVKEQFLPNSAELNALLPQLQKLAQEGEKKPR